MCTNTAFVYEYQIVDKVDYLNEGRVLEHNSPIYTVYAE